MHQCRVVVPDFELPDFFLGFRISDFGFSSVVHLHLSLLYKLPFSKRDARGILPSSSFQMSHRAYSATRKGCGVPQLHPFLSLCHVRNPQLMALIYGRKLFVETFQDERLTGNVLEFLENFELAVRAGFADVNIVHRVMVRLHRGHATRAVEADRAGFQRRANFIHIKRAGILNAGLPEKHTVIGKHQRANHRAFFLHHARIAFGLEPGIPVLQESFVLPPWEST